MGVKAEKVILRVGWPGVTKIYAPAAVNIEYLCPFTLIIVGSVGVECHPPTASLVVDLLRGAYVSRFAAGGVQGHDFCLDSVLCDDGAHCAK